jgi:O-6-methylguanine DNA methyltransferase
MRTYFILVKHRFREVMLQFSSIVEHPITTIVINGVLIGGEMSVVEIIIGVKAKLIVQHMKQQPVGGEAVETLTQQFIRYLNGDSLELPIVKIHHKNRSKFQAAVCAAASNVPYGSTCTYSELALMAGFPLAVRAAASVMRNNRVPLLVPCHRIIKKDGRSGAYCGDPTGPDAVLKKTLLQLEKNVLKKCLSSQSLISCT